MIRTKSFEDVKKEREDALNEQTKGITIISLVITIIVLLILAGISIGLVFNNEGLFNKSSQATKDYNREKSKEKLTLILSDARTIKYTEGMDDIKLDEKLNEAGILDSVDNTKIAVNRICMENR